MSVIFFMSNNGKHFCKSFVKVNLIWKGPCLNQIHRKACYCIVNLYYLRKQSCNCWMLNWQQIIVFSVKVTLGSVKRNLLIPVTSKCLVWTESNWSLFWRPTPKPWPSCTLAPCSPSFSSWCCACWPCPLSAGPGSRWWPPSLMTSPACASTRQRHGLPLMARSNMI